MKFVKVRVWEWQTHICRWSVQTDVECLWCWRHPERIKHMTLQLPTCFWSKLFLFPRLDLTSIIDCWMTKDTSLLHIYIILLHYSSVTHVFCRSVSQMRLHPIRVFRLQACNADVKRSRHDGTRPISSSNRHLIVSHPLTCSPTANQVPTCSC